MLGTNFDDTLVGLNGLDIQRGFAGDNRYFFDPSDADGDVVIELDGEGKDRIVFGGRIALSDITFVRDGQNNNDLVLFLDGAYGTSSVKLFQQYSGLTIQDRVELIEFGDGSTFDLTRGMEFTGTSTDDAGDNQMLGTWWSVTFVAGAGNDEITPGLGNDTVNTGTGMDSVIGTAQQLDGDLLSGMGVGDLFHLTDADAGLDLGNLEFDGSVLQVDADRDGSFDLAVTLSGALCCSAP